MRKKIIIILVIIVLGIIFLFVATRVAVPKITSFMPSDGAADVDLNSDINLTFDRSLNNPEKGRVEVKFSPQEDMDTIWIDKIYKLAPKKGFKSSTKYSVEVDYNGIKILAFSFKTVLFSKEEQQMIQNASKGGLPADYAFSQVLNEMYTKYPWLQKLPIENSSYRIVYDFDKNSFRIRILVSVDSNTQQQLVDQALNDLRNIGVTGNPIPYYVLTP